MRMSGAASRDRSGTLAARLIFSGRGAWNSDATGQLARHLGADTVQDYGEIYQGMTDYSEISRSLGVERNRSLDKVKVSDTPLCRPLAKGAAPA